MSDNTNTNSSSKLCIHPLEITEEYKRPEHTIKVRMIMSYQHDMNVKRQIQSQDALGIHIQSTSKNSSARLSKILAIHIQEERNHMETSMDKISEEEKPRRILFA